MNIESLLSDRCRQVEFSGIRKYFDLAARMKDPCDLSIGQPDYDAPADVREAAIQAIREGRNRYTPSAGIPALRERLAAELRDAYGVTSPVLIVSGVSGGLVLALMATVNPGDEVVFLDPYFVSYWQLVKLCGGTPVPVSSYPDFRFKPDGVEAAITRRTRALIVNSPGNPTGAVYSREDMAAAAEIARRHDLLLITDEIYDRLSYDAPSPCPLPMAPEHTLLLRGFGKTYGVTGWRMGYAAGPERLIAEMTKLQQYTFVCAPSMAQHACLAAIDSDVSHHFREYRRKRDLVCDLLSRRFEIVRPGGGFYVFPRAPDRFPSATAFADAAAEQEVLIIPGCIFSSKDTHFRVSYAATDEMLRRGCDTLCRLAAG